MNKTLSSVCVFLLMLSPFMADETSKTWRFRSTDFGKCICDQCDFDGTVGRILNDKCFYISIYDRLFYDNDVVPILSDTFLNDSDLADGLVSYLRDDFLKKFPSSSYSIIYKTYKDSLLYKTPARSTKCPKLNLTSNVVYDDVNCKLDPAILVSETFHHVFEKEPDQQSTPLILDESVDPSKYNFNLTQCPERNDGFLGDNDLCYFFSESDKVSCILAQILDMKTFMQFESFVVKLVDKMTYENCDFSQTNTSFWQCKLKSFREAYSSFIIYFDPKCTDELTNMYFNINGTKKGYYFVDVPRRRMNLLHSYLEGISFLVNTYGSESTKHFCEEPRVVHTPEQTTVFQSMSTLQSTTMQNISSTNPHNNHGTQRHLVLFLCMGVFLLLLMMSALFYVYVRKSTCSFRE